MTQPQAIHETGAVRKDPGGKLAIALVFPNTYWVGMSNLGLHAMYREFNAHPGIVCERFFTDYPRSVESGRALSDFPLVAFSVSYELDWINVVRILRDNRIALKSADRRGGQIVIAGGAALSMNPEPVAAMLDVAFLGDGEGVADVIAENYSASGSREEFLERMTAVNGAYLPDRTYPIEDEQGIRAFAGPRVRMAVCQTLQEPAHTAIITGHTAFHDMFLVETARGCPFRCRFCAARAIYAPFRPVPVDALEPVFDKAQAAGMKLGLVSTSLNSHPEAEEIFARMRRRNLAMAPPSLRFGQITPGLLEHISATRTRGVTLAPETGSEALRVAVGKPLSDKVILQDIENLILAGIRNIKLYGMAGLPGETLTDIDAMIDLVKYIRHTFIKVSRGNRTLGEVSLSMNTFVPKPHTAFEREAMLDIAETKKRLKRITKGLQKLSNVQVSFEGPKWAYLQAVIARGNRSAFGLIEQLAQSPDERWQDVLRAWKFNPDALALRPRDAEEILPWSFYGKDL